MDSFDGQISDTPNIPETEESDFSEIKPIAQENEISGDFTFDEPEISGADGESYGTSFESDVPEHNGELTDREGSEELIIENQTLSETPRIPAETVLQTSESIAGGADLDAENEGNPAGSLRNLPVESLEEKGSKSEMVPEIIHPDEEINPGEAEPNSTYERNGYQYQIDEMGRTRLVSGTLELGEGKEPKFQSEIGHMGNDGDDGGHLIGQRFNGPADAFNLVPQNANLNRGEWKSMENSWANAVQQGRQVDVMVRPVYETDTSRPDSFEVISQMDGELTYTSFANQPSEKK